MPSKGNPVVKCRIEPETLNAIQREVAISVHRRRKGPHTQASWVADAIRMKLEHVRRCRGEYRRRRGDHAGQVKVKLPRYLQI